MANKYIAFISYRHAEMDSAIAKTLHSLIEQYRIPRGLRKDGDNRLGVVFRDEEELHAASDLSAEIQNALNATQYLIVICSKNSVESPWVTREVEHFLQNHDRSQVFTVLASGEPMEVFPTQLTRTPDGEPIEPLAVDIRADSIAASRKKLRRELPRLISAMLKCPYDALVMREHRRKTRRITAIAAGAMAVLLGFTSMVLLKNQQIELANDQLEEKNTQLNEANVALEEQKAAVQLRESQLLVQSAREDLDNADYYSAMQKAVDALPADASDNRPYYAPAEQVLMESMGVFQTGDPVESLNTTVLEQVTDIADFVITEDGRHVVTTDEFGTVFCFDAESGQQLWYQYAPQVENSLASSNPHLFLCSADQAVIRNLTKTLNAYDLETGQLLWSLDTDSIAEDYLFYHKARNILLFPVSYSKGDFTIAYRLMEVDAATGEILHTIPLFDGSSFYTCSFSNTSTSASSRAGWFSQDGTLFYGAFFDDRQYLQCFEADLSQGTSRIVYTSDETFLTSGETVGVFRDGDKGLYVVCSEAKQDILIAALKIDIDTGNILWKQDIPVPNTLFFRIDEKAFAHYLDSGILIGINNCFYVLDLQTGQVCASRTTTGVITSVEFGASNVPTVFSFSLEDGTCAIGWVKNSNSDLISTAIGSDESRSSSIVFSTDQNLQVSTKLVSHYDLQIWGGGLVQLYLDEANFTLSMGNIVSPGRVLLIPRQQENTLHIIQIKKALSLNRFTSSPIPAEGFSLLSDSSAQKIGSTLLAGRCYHSESYENAYLFLDSATGQAQDAVILPGHFSDGTLFWLPDTLQPLTSYSYDGIALINDDGTKTLLYDPDGDQDALAEEDGWHTSFTLFRCTSAYSADGNTLWSAACNPKTLRVWNNGELSTQVDLPAHLLTDPQESNAYERLLKIGANGSILVSLHDYQGQIPLENTAVYLPGEDRWLTFRSDAVFSDGNAVAFAQEKECMAVMDQNGTIRILDLETGDTVGRFSTHLPAGSVLQMRFFLDDTHLAIKATGGNLLIYEIATGTQVYRDLMPDSYSSTLQVFEDLQHNRLYAVCGSKSGLCLDLGSWTCLAKPDNLLYYDSSTDLVYLTDRGYQNASILCGKIPDTLGLVKQAREALTEQQ